ncbi:MAG: threonine--tRNA ligase [Patescibacteria group bacterium]
MSISKNSQNLALDTKRHSMAHLMAAAVSQMFPEAQFGVGPVIENGCYYDFILPRPLIPEDMPLIEKKMKGLLNRKLVYKQQELSLEEAIELFEKKGQPLKVELLNDLATKGTTSMDESEQEIVSNEGGALKITVYRILDDNTGELLFEDLCKGPHVNSVEELRQTGYHLDKFSAAYWRGDQERDIRMQRIYALIYDTQAEVDKFIADREEAKKRDHRVLGAALKLFTTSELVGAGLPLLQPKGAIIRKLLEDYLWQLQKDSHQRVYTPHITKEALYERSGHAGKYLEDMFSVYGGTSKETFFVKPMNCPMHMQIFADNNFSYKDMPVRYFDPTTVYRDEKTGQLSGLTRVRSITQDDGHLFCRVGQIQEEFTGIVKTIRDFYGSLGMEPDWVSWSVRDSQNPEKYLGDPEKWDIAEEAIRQAAEANSLTYKRVEGEAAFYGPKLDFMFKDCIGREWQLSTIQCDFVQPERFDLSFTNEQGEKERPVVIHRAISGSLERFLGILIEHFAGRFPFWLAPVQVKVLTVNDQVLDYVQKVKQVLVGVVVMQPLKYNELRYEVDDRGESLGKKIREAEMEKVPVMLIVGPKDAEAGMVSVRTQEGESKVELSKLGEYLEGLR